MNRKTMQTNPAAPRARRLRQTTVAVAEVGQQRPYDVDEALALLDEDEHARWERLRRDADRERFVLAHALLRQLVGDALCCPPEQVPMARTTLGAPYVVGAPRLGVSLSHSGGLVAAAVAPGPVGVDVESTDSVVDVPELIRRFCAAEEIPATDAVDRNTALLRVWVRKEAVTKALGRGLGLPLTEITVGSHRPRGPLPQLRRLRVHDVDAGPAHLAAVACPRWVPLRVRRVSPPAPAPAAATAPSSPTGRRD
jgi:4'-phosphopantetheinyl transferase